MMILPQEDGMDIEAGKEIMWMEPDYTKSLETIDNRLLLVISWVLRNLHTGNQLRPKV